MNEQLPETPAVSHSHLVEQGAQWLRKRCPVVVTELVASSGETADAIGWHQSKSILVECKVSLSDFRADAKKIFRFDPDMGMGIERYYLAPKGLIAVEILPEGWGLLELGPKGVRMVKSSGVFKANRPKEISVLLSTLRRIGASAPVGVSIKVYTLPSKNSATLYVEDPEPQSNQSESTI